MSETLAAPCLTGRADLVRSTRDLLERLVATEFDDRLAARLAEQVRAVAEQLPAPHRSTPWYWDLAPEHRDGSTGWYRDNPAAPPLQLSWDGEQVHGQATLGVRFTGPPGRVHGGYVAALLDHTLGALLTHLGRSSMTVHLGTQFLASTPLQEPITTVAGLDRIEGRKTFAWAEIRHQGVTTARAEGVFVTVPGSTHRPDNPAVPGGIA